ncbi:unnamed protein product [Parajaminaea phylloscopi]
MTFCRSGEGRQPWNDPTSASALARDDGIFRSDFHLAHRYASFQYILTPIHSESTPKMAGTAQSSKKPILVVITSHTKLIGNDHPTGWYLPELAHPAYHFRREGYPMIFVSPKGGEAPLDSASVEAFKDDKESQDFLKDEEFQAMVKNTKKLSEVDLNPQAYSAIFYPGGHGPMFDLPVDETSKKLIATAYEAGIPVSAVCHAPAVFADVKLQDGKYLVEGKKLTAFTNEEEEQAGLTKAVPWLPEERLQERGAIFEKAQPWGAKVVVDRSTSGRHTLITGQNPASASGVAEEVIRALKSQSA